MRVISGSARGVTLVMLEGLETRPTAEKVKEAMFSAINFDLPGAHVLDIYAGSGQLGIEALSRGASDCTFVERSRAACAVIRKNIEKAKFSEKSRVITADCEIFLSQKSRGYDIIISDPPYRKGTPDAILPMLADLTAEGGLVLLETERGYQAPAQCGGLRLHKTYHYGNTAVHLYRKPSQETP